MSTTTPSDEPFAWTDREVIEAAGYVFTALLLGICGLIYRAFVPERIAARATRHHR